MKRRPTVMRLAEPELFEMAAVKNGTNIKYIIH